MKQCDYCHVKESKETIIFWSNIFRKWLCEKCCLDRWDWMEE